MAVALASAATAFVAASLAAVSVKNLKKQKPKSYTNYIHLSVA